jgi:hypothetical protein
MGYRVRKIVTITSAEEIDVGGTKTVEIDVGVDFCSRTGFDWICSVGNEFEIRVELVE